MVIAYMFSALLLRSQHCIIIDVHFPHITQSNLYRYCIHFYMEIDIAKHKQKIRLLLKKNRHTPPPLLSPNKRQFNKLHIQSFLVTHNQNVHFKWVFFPKQHSIGVKTNIIHTYI